MMKRCNANRSNFALAIFIFLSIISKIESHPLTETGNMPLVSVLTEAYGEGTPRPWPSGSLIAPKDQPQAFSSPGTIGRGETNNDKRRFSLFGYNFGGGNDSYDEAGSFYPGGGDYPYSGPGGSYQGAGNPYQGSFQWDGGSYFGPSNSYPGAGSPYGGSMYAPNYGGQSYDGSSNYGGSYGQQGPSGYPQSSNPFF